MKTHQPRPRPASGSFGIPQDMQDAHKTFKEKKAAEAAEESAGTMPDGEDGVDEEESGDPDGKDSLADEDKDPSGRAEDFTKLSPRKALAKVGIELTDQDFHSILYRGYVEKEVELIPALGEVPAMKVRMKTLTPEEYDIVDELVATDIESIKGTNLGFQTRRELWTASFSVIVINGRELGKVKREKDGTADLYALVRERRKMLAQLSPAVVNKIIRTHSILTWAISAIVEDPKANF